MDKVKVVLGYVQKYHFWLLSVVAIMFGLFGWMKARGTLDEEYAKNKGTVTGKFSSLSGIQQNQNPPNSDWAVEIAKITKQEQQEVSGTWTALYEAQQQVLAWPEIMPPEFKTFIKDATPNADIRPQWLAAYQTEVLNSEFPKLAQIVGAAPLSDDTKTATSAANATRPAAPGTPAAATADAVTPLYKVQWENQDEVKKWLAFPSGAAPTSFQVRLRQEDYWVYQALLNIIRATNAPAPYVPWIKRIEDLAIGANSAQDFAAGMSKGHITPLAAAEGASEAAVATPNVDAGAGDPTQAAPDQGRYLAADGTILPVGTSQDQQFKRLPISLKLVMDQREITRLLTECANYPLPVEVRQLRINPGGAGAAQTGGGAAAARGSTAVTSSPGDAFDVTVEIHGIIYLFNPPDPVKLGAEATAGAAAPAEG
jgi:hypothetical protein